MGVQVYFSLGFMLLGCIFGIMSLFTVGKGLKRRSAQQLNKVLFLCIAAFISLSLSQFFMSQPFKNTHDIFLLIMLLFVILLVVFIHECGHLIAARKFKVPIEQFSIGFGPSLIQKQFGNTTFHLKALPIGGYVKPTQEGVNELKLFQKIIFYLNGIFFNILSYIIAFGILAYQAHKDFLYGVKIASIKLITAVQMPFHLSFYSSIYSPKHDLVGQMETYRQISHLTESFWMLFAIISLLLAIGNLIPIPILDGGRVVLAILESIMNKLRVNKKYIKGILNSFLLIGLLIYASPFIINNLWSIGDELGLNLVQTILWFALLFTVMMNIAIFIENKRVQ